MQISLFSFTQLNLKISTYVDRVPVFSKYFAPVTV